MIIDVTEDVEFGDVDGEYLELLTCKCGTQFSHWDKTLHNNIKDVVKCHVCGIKLYFNCEIKIFEVKE